MDAIAAHRTPQPVTGLPIWYFVLAGALVASYDISAQFSAGQPWIALLPLVLLAVHLTLWTTVLGRRREFLRQVWRSPSARLLAVGLFTVRLLLQLGLTRLADAVAPLHSNQHLIIGLVMLVLVSVGAWFDQWLIMRNLNRSR